jgi:DNA-binding MarR family transcriptional regulator
VTRNLDLLEKKGLVQRATGTTRNHRICELTTAGDTLLDELLVAWPQARASSVEGISNKDAEIYLRVSQRLMSN